MRWQSKLDRFTDVHGGKILLTIVIVAVLGCLGICLYTSLFTDEAHRSSTYGVTDPTKAVLVIEDRTVAFHIIGTKITREDGQSWDLGRISGGRQGVFPIEPGDYTLEVEYCDHPSLEAVASLSWYVHNTKSAEFSVIKKRATIFHLEGGNVSGIFYTPPELNRE